VRVLLTGASGLIGSHVVPLLVDSGHEVHAVSSKPAEYPAGVQGHILDLLNSDSRPLLATLRPSHLLHLAWNVTPGKFWTTAENVQWLQASLDLVQAFAAEGGQRWVGAGTCAEYDWSQSGVFCEIGATRPATLYGACKCSLQMTADLLGKQLGLEVGWGRIFYPYGPRECGPRLVPSVIRSLLAGERAQCTEGLQVRDFVFVEDVAKAFVALLMSPYQGPVNIGSGVPVTVRHVITRIGEIIGRPDLLEIGALPMRGLEPQEMVADISRLRSIGFQPQYSLDSGLERTIHWWKNRSGKS
jgi:nucleoside-diphosphate-sugar epimerase